MTGPSTFSLRPKPIVSDAENDGLSTTKQVFAEYRNVLAKLAINLGLTISESRIKFTFGLFRKMLSNDNL